VGAVQRLATMVIVGLVALSTILVLYLADEGNRIKAEEKDQLDASIERAEANYISLCLPCHGPAGEGYTEGTGRPGAPLGGPNTSVNQHGVNAQGTPVSGGLDKRTQILHDTITNGRPGTIMPAWGDQNGGPLNFDQINELVTMIQNVDWNQLYNLAIKTDGGYPTVAPTAAPTQAAAQPTTAPGNYAIALEDIKFDITQLTLPPNTDITINLTNKGATTHNFNIDELNVHSGDIAAGGTGKVTFKTGAAGTTYQYYCNIPGHRQAGMQGTITVSEQAAAPAAGSPAAGASPVAAGAPAAQTTFNVKLEDIHFDVTEIDAPANTDITVNVTNAGATTHNFTVPDLNNVTTGDLAPGESKSITFNTGAAGQHQYECTIPGHAQAGMVGTLVVK
jgi:uncharacterized cupredoxin-like copper-binding protein